MLSWRHYLAYLMIKALTYKMQIQRLFIKRPSFGLSEDYSSKFHNINKLHFFLILINFSTYSNRIIIINAGYQELCALKLTLARLKISPQWDPYSNFLCTYRILPHIYSVFLKILDLTVHSVLIMQFPLYHGLAQRLPCRKSATIIFELKKNIKCW